MLFDDTVLIEIQISGVISTASPCHSLHVVRVHLISMPQIDHFESKQPCPPRALKFEKPTLVSFTTTLARGTFYSAFMGNTAFKLGYNWTLKCTGHSRQDGEVFVSTKLELPSDTRVYARLPQSPSDSWGPCCYCNRTRPCSVIAQRRIKHVEELGALQHDEY